VARLGRGEIPQGVIGVDGDRADGAEGGVVVGGLDDAQRA
jgi:hypothetical protein